MRCQSDRHANSLGRHGARLGNNFCRLIRAIKEVLAMSTATHTFFHMEVLLTVCVHAGVDDLGVKFACNHMNAP